MEQELGVPWEDVFESIDPQPLAAGTIAQVHRATLADGDRVVVKVQRPDAREEIEQDLGAAGAVRREGARPPGAQAGDRHGRGLRAPVRRRCTASWTSGRRPANIERMREVIEGYSRLDGPRRVRRAVDRRGCW